jgi:hypothetical protein
MMICDKLQDDLESSTFRNRALTPTMKVFVALRFYASGSFQGVIADTTYIHTYINKTQVVSKSLTIKHVYDILVFMV